MPTSPILSTGLSDRSSASSAGDCAAARARSARPAYTRPRLLSGERRREAPLAEFTCTALLGKTAFSARSASIMPPFRSLCIYCEGPAIGGALSGDGGRTVATTDTAVVGVFEAGGGDGSPSARTLAHSAKGAPARPSGAAPPRKMAATGRGTFFASQIALFRNPEALAGAAQQPGASAGEQRWWKKEGTAPPQDQQASSSQQAQQASGSAGAAQDAPAAAAQQHAPAAAAPAAAPGPALAQPAPSAAPPAARASGKAAAPASSSSAPAEAEGSKQQAAASQKKPSPPPASAVKGGGTDDAVVEALERLAQAHPKLHKVRGAPWVVRKHSAHDSSTEFGGELPARLNEKVCN